MPFETVLHHKFMSLEQVWIIIRIVTLIVSSLLFLVSLFLLLWILLVLGHIWSQGRAAEKTKLHTKGTATHVFCHSHVRTFSTSSTLRPTAYVIPHKERNLFNTESPRPRVSRRPHARPPTPKQTLVLPQPNPNTPKRAAPPYFCVSPAHIFLSFSSSLLISFLVSAAACSYLSQFQQQPAHIFPSFSSSLLISLCLYRC